MTTSEIYKLSGSAPKEKQKNRSTISFLPQLMHWRLYSGWLGWTWASSKGCFGEVMSWFTSEVTYGCVPFIRAHNGMLQGLCCFSLWCFSNYSSGIHIAEWKEIKSRHLNMCFGVTLNSSSPQGDRAAVPSGSPRPLPWTNLLED